MIQRELSDGWVGIRPDLESVLKELARECAYTIKKHEGKSGRYRAFCSIELGEKERNLISKYLGYDEVGRYG